MDVAFKILYKTNIMQLPRHVQSFTHHPGSNWRSLGYSILRAGHVEAAPDSYIERQHHDGQDILFCLSGRGVIESRGWRHEVCENQLAWLSNELPHAHRADPADPWQLMWVRLVGPDEPALRTMVFGENKCVFDVAEPERMRVWFQRLFAALERRDTMLDLELNQLVATLLMLLSGRQEGRREHGSPLPRRVAKAITAMRTDLAHPWSAEQLERVCGVSATHLRRLFAIHLGTSPRKWLVQERLLKAQNLLADTGLSVTEIGALCGFSDVFHFSREFKRYIGSSPAHWRKSEKVF